MTIRRKEAVWGLGVGYVGRCVIPMKRSSNITMRPIKIPLSGATHVGKGSSPILS